MTSLLDSSAQFAQRAKELGIGADLIKKFKDQGLDTLNKYGFSHGQPGQAIEDAAFTAFLEGILGAGQSLAILAASKNLLFEAHVFITASLKNRVETSSDTVKTIPLAERSARLAAMRAKLQGVAITQALEPAFGLLDSVTHQYEQRQLKYVPPSRCPSREQELMSNKTSPKILEVEGNSIKVKESNSTIFVETPTEFLVYQALRRRALSYEFADLISFDVQMRWIDWLFNELSKSPPKGFQPTQLFQVLRADRAAFLYLAENCTEIRPQAGLRPLDALFERLPVVHSVVFCLFPLPAFGGKAKGKGKSKWEHQGEREKPTYQPYTAPKGKGKSKTKTKDSGRKPNMPYSLVGLHYKTTDGAPICFAFNLPGGCNNTVKDNGCDRGKHVCSKCMQSHSFTACPSKGEGN